MFVHSLCSSCFIILFLLSLIEMLKYTLPLRCLLQTKLLDVHCASYTIADTDNTFKNNSENHYMWNLKLKLLNLVVVFSSPKLSEHRHAEKVIHQSVKNIIKDSASTVSEIYLLGEFKQWEAKLGRDVNTKEIPETMLEVLDDCGADVFPTILVLLQILCTIPVSVATTEHSFSTLLRVKSWVGARMT
ncbi:hypothetical protein PR048_006418 [Dryococelus australis]|uniref:HAT C-terminal dimerisation domain-containing protein n=1 Tax=Dryococelus australis TaxID=614101 RepID=A0ABQ9IAY5_9NEOP|nr:hypothetical protein PR048_006418 [Dryococelus australis]